MIPIGMLLEVGSKILDKVLPDPEAKARAQVALMEMQQKGELAQIQADMNEQDNLTKNIRPMTLIYILTAYLALAVMDAMGLDISDNFVSLLGQWGMLVMSFYFGGRTLEKVMDMKGKKDAAK
jgi:hypothetical protein